MGMGYKSVAANLGIAMYTARDWARAFREGKFTVKPKKIVVQHMHTEEERQQVLAFRESGMSWKEIERETGISSTTARAWVKKAKGQRPV